MATPAGPQGTSSSGNNSSSTADPGAGGAPGSEVAADRIGASPRPAAPTTRDESVPAAEAEPAAPNANAEGRKRRRPASSPQQPKEAERDEQNTVERQGPGEVKAEPLALDARVTADIARLAAIRARDRAEAGRVLNETRTKPAEPLIANAPVEKSRRKVTVRPPAAPAPQEDEERDAFRIPQEISNDFVRVGQKYFPRDDPKHVAFVDAGTTLKTPSDSPERARALVAIAEARSWGGIKVRGSAEFKREVFIEASARGMGVTGYRGNDADLAEIEARVTRYAERNAIEMTSARAQDFRQLPPDEAMRRPDLAAAVVAADAVARIGDAVRDPKLRARLQGGFRDQLAEGLARGDVPRPLDDAKVGARIRVPEGEYIESGRARYQFDADEKENFYVRYRRPDGEVKVSWGKGLEAALREADARPGDTIRLQREGAQAVKVVGNVRDAQNKVVGQKEIAAERNEWKVEVVKRSQEKQIPPPERSRGR